MRTIEGTNAFKRDYKRTRAVPKHKDIESLLSVIVESLANDEPLAEKYHDHSLFGGWKGYRECHLKPDLLLIYQKPNSSSLRLIRLGSHNQLFS
jgi:mRNA interferase YafQ